MSVVRPSEWSAEPPMATATPESTTTIAAVERIERNRTRHDVKDHL
ncbi:hypothetical protein [Halogranum rubrum]|nr:hypothetical protein [Halogranum rubrum]